ncbi:hypothetical protein MEO40_17015, partial [Dolichospermum sp. ST_sed1]|nr:hypothetical protein [Dolichospermum sp. ST_sed1]
SDKKSHKLPQSIIKNNPENPLILDILIQTKKVINSHNNPVNPKILDILIQTKKVITLKMERKSTNINVE